MKRTVQLYLVCQLLLAFAVPARGHFPWIAVDDSHRVLVFFSESHLERDYHLPKCVEEAKIHVHADDGIAELELTTLNSDEFIGRRSNTVLSDEGQVRMQCQYGVYHGTLLSYYAKYAPRESDKPVSRLDLTMARKQGGWQVRAWWDGEPLAGAKITLIDAAGEPSQSKTADQDGRVFFESAGKGLCAFRLGHTLSGVSGERAGEEYKSETHYLTCTFSSDIDSPDADDVCVEGIPPLPRPIASFGGVTCDGWLYVYGGHTGRAHAHSNENLAASFLRTPCRGSESWETLPMQTPLQGLALVTHNGMIYRVGGMSARNAPGEDDDLHSVDEFCRFDPTAKDWETLAPLPEPRSSHDAVVINDTLFVVGGWQLAGPGHGEWHESAWQIDLGDENPQWRSIPEPPFQRRALAAASFNDKLVVLCGMNSDGEVTQRVDCYDPASGKWERLADFPGEGVHGFGISAFNDGTGLYASGAEGAVYRLADDGSHWDAVGTLEKARFFHRILPAEAGLIAVAGASFDHGHLGDIERIVIKR